MLASASAASGIAACAVLALAWADVLPGGWWLRGLAEPHAIREARERSLHFAARLREFAHEEPDALRHSVVFLGSSTVERCPLATAFPGCRAVNRGVGWARARELASHVDALLADPEPSAIVLYAGGPDRVAAPLAVEDVLGAIEALARAVRERAPRTPVLLLGLLPSTRSLGPEADALLRIDRGIARIAAENGFEHVDFRGSGLTGPDGALVESLSTDGLHLTPAGYAIFTQRLRAAPEPFASLLAG
ncbi:MAG: GDSL-type esterase/lipase family protein [Planctomycetota bacterium]|nr:GDSL-type esterase/lipase family protein [Planctomycetota bacterium]